ncbi:hypothetical protein [Schleiferilactobacillus perolens]|uniref:Uncharacterized protein n=1 Tax=Schleiferilactobacillus perolens DSM 12744 TaxID=1423792 RepID=A0A0R1MSY4_9LACO|nr:hypothetical protein [Schleiferilactobacillus perolens]KRL08058.1 hypothetical protein FD09_GL001704 [Schleiferilactobacillus perolens DSM 12744]
MNVILVIDLAHSPFYYYLIAMLSYLGVLSLLVYYCRTCILTSDKSKKIFILLGMIIFSFVAAIILVGMMNMSGYEAQLAQPITVAERAIDSAWGGALGVFLVGLGGCGVPVLVNYYYFKRELMPEANLQVRQHFYATNSSWLATRLGCVFIMVSTFLVSWFIVQVLAKITEWTPAWRVFEIVLIIVLIIGGAYVSRWVLHSNDWVFWWKPWIANDEDGQT